MNDPMRSLQVNNTPLQIAGEDETLREYTLGGPECGRDVRLFLDRKVLEHLLDVSKSSNTGRVVSLNKSAADQQAMQSMYSWK